MVKRGTHPNSLKNLEQHKGQFGLDSDLARKANKKSTARKLQKKNIREGGYTLDEDFNELLEFQQKMEKQGLWGLCLRAQELKGKLAGHYVDRQEVMQIEPPVIIDDIK